MDIIEQMRRAREGTVEVGGITIKFRRPTDLDSLSMQYEDMPAAVEGVCKFVVGWDNVTRADLVPNESDQPVRFSSELFLEWIKDNPEAWQPLVSAVLDAYTQHRQSKEQAGNVLEGG